MAFPAPLVRAAELAALLAERPGDLVIADCRFNMAEPSEGRQAYREGHLPGAVYFHVEEQLSGPEGAHGGRHPLPDPDRLSAALGAAGIGPETFVVAYDTAGQYAARFWWLLRWLGHDRVAVLDGGLPAWVRAGLPLSTEVPAPVQKRFLPQVRPEMVAEMEEVRDRPAGVVVVDARSPQRFAGEPNPLDPKPGHVPGAVNRFWEEAYGEGGLMRSADEQRARFAGLPSGPDLIHQCGSGITACVNLLAMEMAGLRGSRLYVGSWSDWCSYPENPVEGPAAREKA